MLKGLDYISYNTDLVSLTLMLKQSFYVLKES